MYRILFNIFTVALSANFAAPLFAVYQRQYQLTTFDITLLFSIYAVCMLPMLLISSQLSDWRGLKKITLYGVAIALLSALTFASADRLWLLYLGRALEGIALGTFMGTANTLLATSAQNPAMALTRSSICTMFGFGLGPAMSGLLVEFGPEHMEQYAFVLLAALLVLAFALLFGLPVEKDFAAKPLQLKLQFSIPQQHRPFFMEFIAPSIFVLLALNGLVISLVPLFVKNVLASDNLAVTGLLLLIMLGGSGITQLSTRPSNRIIRAQAGVMFMLLGTWCMILSGIYNLMALLFIGMFFQAIGNGWGFQACLQLAGKLGSPQEKAGIFSTFFLFNYSGMAFPTIGIGLAANFIGLMPSLLCFGTLISFCSCIIIALAYRRQQYRLHSADWL